MPTANGVSVLGRQVLVTMAATDTAASVSVREAVGNNAIIQKYYGYLRLERALSTDGNRLIEWSGGSIWCGGVIVVTPRSSQVGGVLTQVVAYWSEAGRPWVCTTG